MNRSVVLLSCAIRFTCIHYYIDDEFAIRNQMEVLNFDEIVYVLC